MEASSPLLARLFIFPSWLALLSAISPARAQTIDWNQVTGAPTALGNWTAAMNATVDTTQSVEGGSSLKLDLPSSNSLPADGNNLRFLVQGPGYLTFRWKSWLEGNGSGAFSYVDAVGQVQGVALAGISGRQDWEQVSALIPPGQHLMQWRVYGGGISQPNAVWVDDVKMAGVPMVSAEAAADISGLTLQTSGWQGLSHHMAFDGSDAVFAGNAPGNFLRASMTGPGWLSFARLPSRHSPQWVQERLFIQPGPQQVEWVFPDSTTSVPFAMAIDTMQFVPSQQVSLAAASDFPGTWTGNALGIVDPSAGVTGGSVIMPGMASVMVTGPGIVRFSAQNNIRFQIGPAADTASGNVAAWSEHSYAVPHGLQTLTWGYGGEILPYTLLDHVRYSPDAVVPLVEALESDLPVETTGGYGVADASASHDGVDCAVLRGTGEVRVPLTGPGRLTAWVHEGDVYLDDLKIHPAASGWRYLSVDVDDGPHTVKFPVNTPYLADCRVDQISYQPGAAARYADILGSAPAGLWTFLGESPATVLTEGAEQVLVSGKPSEASLRLYSKAAVAWTAGLDVYASAGLTGLFHAANSGFGSDSPPFPPQRDVWAGTASYVTAPSAPGTSWLNVEFYNGSPGSFWKLKSAIATLPSQQDVPSLAEALDSELPWTSLSPGWTAYGAAPWFGGGDALYVALPAARITAAVAGPAFARFNYKGSLAAKIDGVAQGNLTKEANTHVSYIPEGNHSFELAGNGSGAADAFTALPPVWQVRDEIECSGVTVAQPPGSAQPEILSSDLTHDGQDGLKLTAATALFAKADSPGFITWWGRGNGSIPWQKRTVEALPGAMVVRMPSTAIDEVRLLPKLPVALADALDFSQFAFTATPAGSWSGFDGVGLGYSGSDAVSVSEKAVVAVKLELALPEAGVLTWWWRKETGGTLTHPSGSAAPGGTDASGQPRWEFAYLNAVAARSASWQATGPPGSVWLDGMAWQAGPPGPAKDGLDAPDLAFTADSGSWITVPMNGAAGGDAAFSNHSTAAIQTTITGPAALRFAVMSRSSGGLTLTVNGTALSTTGPESRDRWSRQTVYLGAGTYTVSWKPSGSVSGDRFFLDDLRLDPIMPPAAAELAAALDAPAMTFTGEGPVLATGPAESHDRTSAVSLATDSGTASLTASADRGQRIRFWWSAPKGPFAAGDGGRFLLDGVEVARIRPGTDWTEFVFDLPGTGAAQLQWRSENTAVRLDELALTPLPTPTVTAATAAGWLDDSWLGDPSKGGGGWSATDALSVDGVAALSDGPAVLDLMVSGPGWLHFDYAAAGIEVQVDERIEVALKRSGPLTEAAADALMRRGFRTDAVEIAAGSHRVRISAGGYAALDRIRLLPALESGILQWTASPHTWTATVAPGILQVASAVGLSEWTARVAGPGSLTFDWNTKSFSGEPYVDALLDGERQHQLYSTKVTPWGMKTDLPPGMHTYTLRFPSQRPIQLSNIKVSPGAMPMAAAAASNQVLRWSNAGNPWQLGLDSLLSPASSGSDSDLSALVPGLSWVSWPSDALPAWARLRSSGFFRTPLLQGNRTGFLLDRADTWLLNWYPGSAAGGQFVRDVQITPLGEVTPDQALEAPAGWDLSLPADRKWHALKGPEAAFDSFANRDALITSLRAGEVPSAVRALVQGPIRSVFTWSAPVGLAGYGGGEFTRGGAHLLKYGQRVDQYRETVTAPEHCIIDLPAGLHDCGWRGLSGYSLAVDNLGPAAGPGIAEVLGAPGIPWAMVASSRDLADQVEVVEGEDILRVESSTASQKFGQISAQITGPAVMHCRIRALGSVEAVLGSKTVRIPATDWRDLTLIIPDQGLTQVTLRPSVDTTMWLDAARFERADTAVLSASPAAAADAADLAWNWANGWKAANEADISLDKTGYAEGTFTSATTPVSTTLTVSGPGTLSFRAMVPGSLKVKDGTAVLMDSQRFIFDWTSYLFPLGAGTHIVTFAAEGPFRLDAVTWTPAIPQPTAGNAFTDSDGDGVPLLVEYAFGLSATAPDARLFTDGISSGLPNVDLVETEAGPRLRVQYPARYSGIRYIPEFSDSPGGGWQAAPAAAVRLVDSMNGLWARYEAIDPAAPARRSRFARIRVQVSP